MSDIFVSNNVTATCQDGATRENNSLLVRNGQFVFLDADGEVLEGERRVAQINHIEVTVKPRVLSILVARYGPILS
jgi:hypothetical protein